MVDHVSSNEESRSSLRWGAIFAGVFVALATMGLLYALGLGAGLSAVDVDVNGRLHDVGIFAGVYGAVVPLLAMLAGGFAAGRAARSQTVGVGAFHGWVLWGVAAVALIWVTFHVAGAILGSAADVAGGAIKASGEVIAGGAKALGASGEALGQLAGDAQKAVEEETDLDVDDLLGEINKRRAKGAAPVTVEQLRAAGKAIGRKALQKGGLERDDVIAIVMKKTAITREEADQVAGEVDKRVQEFHKAFEEKKKEAEAKANEVRQQAEARAKQLANATAEQLAHVCWGLFATLAAGLAASVAGGALAAISLRTSRA